MGNVMVDIAHWLICERKIEEVVVIARRGPNERAYTDKEMREIIQALDEADLEQEFARIEDKLTVVGQDPASILADIKAPQAKAYDIDSPTKFKFRFLVSSKQIIADEQGRICGLEVEHNELVAKGEKLRPKGTGETTTIPLDTLVFAIGDQVDEKVGLPYEWGQYMVPKEAHPTVEGRARYEVFDPEAGQVIEGWFVGGWARIASDGLVGKARADGETAVEEVLAYLATKDKLGKDAFETRQQKLISQLKEKQVHYVTRQDVQTLEGIEQQKAAEQGRDFFKFNTNAEMLEAIEGGTN